MKLKQEKLLSMTHNLISVLPKDKRYKTLLKSMVKDKKISSKDILDNEKDEEFRDMAKIELDELQDTKERLEEEIKFLLIPKDPEDEKDVIFEIRSGAGGDEASLFAGDLYKMYSRYFSLQGWKVEPITINEGSVGGYNKIVLEINGTDVYGKLKFESGVHRVQRVPVTETQGRIHTSAATVAVLPEPEDVDIGFSMTDVRVDTMRASGAGGQHVNKTDSAVRMTHVPTGVVVVCDAKSQHMNRANAERLLKMKRKSYKVY